MRILGLDLSTSTGWAILSDEKLVGYGRIQISPDDKLEYPLNFIECAHKIACNIQDIVTRVQPDHIVIEETNQSKSYGSRFSQKLLEYIHFAVADHLWFIGKTPKYMNSAQWQSLVGLHLSKDQRKNNKLAKEMAEKEKEQIKKRIELELARKYVGLQAIDLPLDQRRKVDKERKEEFKKLFQAECRKIRVKVDGEQITKVSKKHLSVALCNQIYGTQFKQKDNDIADSLLMSRGYLMLMRRNHERNHQEA